MRSRRVTRKTVRNPYTYKKRTYRRKYPMSRAPVPATKAVYMKYSDIVTINPTAGVLGINIFSCNGLFDPDITGAGHQPMGFDQWMSFYEHYTVLGSKITAIFTPNSATVGTGQMICGIYTDSNTTSTSTITTMVEQPGTRFGFVPLAGAAPPIRITKTFSSRKFFGKPRGSLIAANTYKGTDAANPTEGAFFHVFCGASDATSDPGAVFVQVLITYYAILTERQTLAAS